MTRFPNPRLHGPGGLTSRYGTCGAGATAADCSTLLIGLFRCSCQLAAFWLWLCCCRGRQAPRIAMHAKRRCRGHCYCSVAREGCAQGEKGKRKRETWGESQIICNGKSLFYVFMRLTCVLQRVVAEQTNLRLPSAPPLHSLWSFRRLSDRIQQQQQQHAGCPSPSSRRALSSGPHCSEWG